MGRKRLRCLAGVIGSGPVIPQEVSVATLDGQLTAFMANRHEDLSHRAAVATSALNARPHHGWPWSLTANCRSSSQFWTTLLSHLPTQNPQEPWTSTCHIGQLSWQPTGSTGEWWPLVETYLVPSGAGWA